MKITPFTTEHFFAQYEFNTNQLCNLEEPSPIEY
jgi:hypothetical protein